MKRLSHPATKINNFMINNLFRHICIILLLVPLTVSAVDYQYEDEPVDDGIITELNNFQEEIKQARLLKRPLMIQFSTSWCEYCEALEEQVLKPMIRNADYADKIAIRKFEVDNNWLVDIYGKQVSGENFALEHNVDLYPTLVFFDGEGNEVPERIVGIAVLEYMGELIDRSLEKARRAFP